MSITTNYQGLIHRYRDYLPVTAKTPVVTLLEGNTPLIPLVNIPKRWQDKYALYVKYEGANPTGSFKDRGMTMAVSKALEEGAQALICASTGNTSAAAAAYGARAGLPVFVVIPEGKIALGKLVQAQIYGAQVIQIQGNFDDAMALVLELGHSGQVTVVNSVNPYRLQGQKTAAFEIVQQLGGCGPDYHYLPVGNAGNITAYWMGYESLYEAGDIQSKPVMVGWQAAGASPFVKGVFVDDVHTVATAIRIGHPENWKTAWQAQQASGGRFDAVTDDAILEAQRWLGGLEGIFCEPASAASVAGVVRDIEDGKVPVGSTVVCTLTGNGLKDPQVVQQQPLKEMVTIAADKAAVEKVVFGA
ncbi:MAG: threonine synthase [Gammaproteobacteria bacterium]